MHKDLPVSVDKGTLEPLLTKHDRMAYIKAIMQLYHLRRHLPNPMLNSAKRRDDYIREREVVGYAIWRRRATKGYLI